MQPSVSKGRLVTLGKTLHEPTPLHDRVEQQPVAQCGGTMAGKTTPGNEVQGYRETEVRHLPISGSACFRRKAQPYPGRKARKAQHQ
jgi:hypothetical protein